MRRLPACLRVGLVAGSSDAELLAVFVESVALCMHLFEGTIAPPIVLWACIEEWSTPGINHFRTHQFSLCRGKISEAITLPKSGP